MFGPYTRVPERPAWGGRVAEVRVLVGTRKGAFVITSDGTRRDWKIEGPHFGGWEVMHIQGSPADADRLYASQWTDWHGQVVQRSDDGGKSCPLCQRT